LVSHELKTPLTVLQMQLDTLFVRLSASDPKVSTKLQRAAQSSERLATLVDSLLDVSRLATGKFKLEVKEFDLVETVMRVVDGFRAAAKRMNTDLLVDSDARVIGTWDPLRLEQLLTNLLSNATKYAAGKPIHVSVHASAGEVVIEVRDQGPGIPEEQLGLLFQRFQRATSLRHYGGLGLGLFL